ncbi:putative HRDC domain-containing protein [Helianthus debilis subsp. tardiflorus]
MLEKTQYLLYIYDLMKRKLLSSSTDPNCPEASLVEGLCEWRDVIAHLEDESTGYILPNKFLIEIAKQMPVTTGKLRHLLK